MNFRIATAMTKAKQTSQIEVTLDTSSAMIGLDRTALIANVEAEVRKLESHAKGESDKISVVERKDPPPAGSQDLVGAIHWIIQFAEDPARAPLYARGLIYGINEIMKAAHNDKKIKDEDRDRQVVIAKMKVFGKEIAFPVANKIIEEILKSLNSGG